MKKARHTVYMVLLSCVSWANCFSFLSLSFLICQIRVTGALCSVACQRSVVSPTC